MKTLTFNNPNPATGSPGTLVTTDWFQNVNDEIALVITNAGITLSPTDHTQLNQALQKVYAPLNSPNLTGTPTTTTPPDGDDSQKICNTAWVNSVITAGKLGYTPVRQGGVSDQTNDTVYIGNATDGSGLKATINADDLGNFAFESWVEGNYLTLTGGNITGSLTLQGTSVATVNTVNAAETDVKNWTESNYEPLLGYTPVQEGGGFDQVAGKIYLGRDSTYNGLRYSYTATDGTITPAGYLISSYGPENGGPSGYGQIGDISSDTNGRLVWRSASLGSTYYTTALLSDVTSETTRAEAAESTLSANFANYLPLDVGGTNKEITYGDGNNYNMRFQNDGNLIIVNERGVVFAAGAGVINLALPVVGNVRSGTVPGGTYTVINNVMTLSISVNTSQATETIDWPIQFSGPPVVSATMLNTSGQGGVSAWVNFATGPTATSVTLFTRSAAGGVDYNAHGLVHIIAQGPVS